MLRLQLRLQHEGVDEDQPLDLLQQVLRGFFEGGRGIGGGLNTPLGSGFGQSLNAFRRHCRGI